MGFTLDKVVPWGRSYAEYVKMFSLSDTDLAHRILGCGDGPASFNSSLTEQGGNIISLDPIYHFNTAQIKQRVTEIYTVVLEQLRNNKSDYIWHDIQSVEELGAIRLAAMELFLADYDAGKKQGRYIAGELPSLPFENQTFDLALSSHFLFLYSEHLSAEFHLLALQEMLRVAREVRVFPIVTLNGSPSPHLAFIIDALENQQMTVEIRTVNYEFQRGAICSGLQSKPHEPAISAISDRNYLQLAGSANRDYLQLNLQSFIPTCNHLRQTDIICN